tara:strand:+ start:51 stop:494 length:444 start_codon:yes stop_codon:yes gene_type:complete
MTALEPILAILLGAGLSAVVAWMAKILDNQKAIQYGEILGKAYDIIDPLLEKNLKSWKGSDVEYAMELAIASVSDNELTAEELKDITKEAAERWLPAKAVDKVRGYLSLEEQPSEIKAADLLSKAVEGVLSTQQAISAAKEELNNVR